MRRAKLGAKAIGFDFAALSGWRAAQWVDDLVRDPALLRPLLARRGLRLISGWSSGRLLERSVAEELEAVEPHRALLAAIGCTVLVYAETTGGIAGDRARPLSSRPSLPEGGWREFGIRLTELADRLAERGLRLAYHHHMGTVVETPAEIERLMAATGGSVYRMAAWTAHQPCPLQGRPAGCAGTRSLRR